MSCPNIETFMANDGHSYCRKAASKNMMIVYMEKEKCILRQMHIKSLTFKKKSIVRDHIKSVSYISSWKQFLLVPHEGKPFLLSLVDNRKSFLRHTSVNEVLATAYDEGRDIIILARPWTCNHCSMLSFLTINGTQFYEVDGCITKDIAVDTKRSDVFLLCANGNIRRLKDNNEGSSIVSKRLAKNHLCMDSRNDLLYYMTMKQGITGIWRINLSTYTDMNLATFKYECPGFHISGNLILIAQQRGRQLKVLKVSSKRKFKTIENLTVKSSKQFPGIQFIPIP